MAAEPRALRILMILDNCYPALRGGGAEAQVRTLALYLKRHGHRVTILTPRVPHGSQTEIARHEGIPVRRLRYPFVRGVGALVLWARLLAFLWRRRRRYDAWHVHIVHYFGALAIAAGHRVGVPVVAKISGQWELQRGLLAENIPPQMRLARALLNKVSAFQAISQNIAATLRARSFDPARIVVLPNAVDLSRFRKKEYRLQPDLPLTIVYAGRLQKHKGLDTLFAAWAKAFPPSSAARLLLAGAGEDEPKLREQAAALGISHMLKFLGFREDVEAVLAEADLGVLPSIIEGLSNTLLEYMACGLPVIASRVSGSEDFVVTGHNGWLFPVGDVDALADCLRSAASLSRETLRAYGERARRDVESQAGIDSVVGRLMALYRGTPPAELTTNQGLLALREGD